MMMMRGIALLSTLAALLAAGPPQATSSDNVISWASSWEEAKIEASERNVPIFFTIQQDENPGSKQMENAFRDGSLIRESKRAVFVIANPDTKHGVREVMVGRTKVPYCRAYDGIQCDVHIRCQSANAHFFKEGDFGIPTQVWCRANGEELFRATGPQGDPQSASSIIKDLGRALDRISGPKMTRREWEQLKKLLQEGDEANGRRDFKLAMKYFKAVMDCKFEKFAARGKDRYDGLISQCLNIVTRALKQWHKYPKDSKESKEVKPMLQKIAKEMKGNEAGKAAEEALKEIK